MNRRNAMLLALFLACLAAAAFAASCHCGDPNTSPPPLASMGGGAAAPAATIPPLGARGGQGNFPLLKQEGERGSYARLRSALTSTVTTDADFLTANRGYGIVEDTSVSAGNIRRSLGLPNFGLANVNPTVDGWQTTTSFTTARQCHSSAVYRGYIYVIGGQNSGEYSDVQYAKTNADGTVGQWSSTTSLPRKSCNHASVVYNGYLYVLGGWSQTTGTKNEVNFAKFNGDGTIGQWATTASFDVPRTALASFAHNGFLYVVGGSDGFVYFKDVQFARINPDGTVEPWSATTDMPDVRIGGRSVAASGHVYLSGGVLKDGVTPANDVFYSKLNADGTIGSWTQAPGFPNPRYYHTSVAYHDRLYIFGGSTGAGNQTDDVQFAEIKSDGSLGSWVTTTRLPAARHSHATLVSNGFAFVIGGERGGTCQNDVLFAPIRPDGHVGTTWVVASHVPEPVSRPTSVIYKGYLYAAGGALFPEGYSNSVRHAPVFPDGTLGTWRDLASFTQGRSIHTMHAHKPRQRDSRKPAIRDWRVGQRAIRCLCLDQS